MSLCKHILTLVGLIHCTCQSAGRTNRNQLENHVRKPSFASAAFLPFPIQDSVPVSLQRVMPLNPSSLRLPARQPVIPHIKVNEGGRSTTITDHSIVWRTWTHRKNALQLRSRRFPFQPTWSPSSISYRKSLSPNLNIPHRSYITKRLHALRDNFGPSHLP